MRGGTLWIETDTKLLWVVIYIGTVASWSPVSGTANIWFNVVTQFGADPTGVQSASASFNAAGTAAAAVGGTVYVPAGTYNITAVILLPAHVTWEFSPSAVLVNNQVFTGGLETANVFHSGRFANGYLVPPAIVSTTTLSATPTKGTSTVSTVGLVHKGNFLAVQQNDGVNNNKYQLFRINGVAGLGPYTVTLDHPVEWNFSAGQLCTELARVAEGVVVNGNGARIQCNGGDAAIQFVESYRCEVNDLLIDGTGGTNFFAAINDTMSRENVWRDITIRNFTQGFVASSSESSSYYRFKVYGVAGGAGLTSWDNIRNIFFDCEVLDCGDGISLDTNGGNYGGIGTQVLGGRYEGCVGQGVTVDHSQQSRITNVECKYNSTGVSVTANAVSVDVDGVDVSFSLSNPITCLADGTRFARIRDVRTAASASAWTLTGNNIQVDDSNCDMSAIVAGGISAINTSGSVRMRGMTFALGTGATFGPFVVAGLCYVDDTLFTGGGGAGAAVVAGGASLVLGQFVNLSGLALTIAGFCNVGPVATLPTALLGSNTLGYATNGRNAGEGAGSGTGTLVNQHPDATWHIPGIAAVVAA